MKTLIVYASVHHGNTQKVAETMALAIGCDLKNVTDADIHSFSSYDLIGFGSGIFFGKHHKTLLDFAQSIPDLKGKKVFVFSTYGLHQKGFHDTINNILKGKGAEIVGEFGCRGWDTVGPLKLIGGIAKNHPDKKDLENAVKFIENLGK